jgi:hypothetical protein
MISERHLPRLGLFYPARLRQKYANIRSSGQNNMELDAILHGDYTPCLSTQTSAPTYIARTKGP